MNPYKKATEPPDGITIPKLPARHIQVLVAIQFEMVDKGDAERRKTNFRIAKLMPTIVSFDRRGLRCPSPL